MFFFFSSFYLPLAALGLYCCPRAFSSCSECRSGFFCCGAQTLERGPHDPGAQALLPCGVWDLPQPRVETVSPAFGNVTQPLDHQESPYAVLSWWIQWPRRVWPRQAPTGHTRTLTLIHTPHGQVQPSFWTFSVTELLGPDGGQKLKSLPCRCPRLDESPN